MNTSIDVLAIIDHEISIWAGRMSSRHTRVRWPHAGDEHAKWKATRAAVAGLFDAVRSDIRGVARSPYETRADRDRIVAAFAFCDGGKGTCRCDGPPQWREIEARAGDPLKPETMRTETCLICDGCDSVRSTFVCIGAQP